MPIYVVYSFAFGLLSRLNDLISYTSTERCCLGYNLGLLLAVGLVFSTMANELVTSWPPVHHLPLCNYDPLKDLLYIN